MKRVLITGGAGFIGSNLALNLLKRKHEVTVLDTLSPQVHGTDPLKSSLYASIRDKVTFIMGSVTDRDILSAALDGQQAVIHLAAETGTGQSMYEIEKYTNVNIGGTALLLDLLVNKPHSVKKVIVASSRSIYGEGAYRRSDQTIVYPGTRKEADMSRSLFEVQSEVGDSGLELIATDEESRIHPSSVYGISKQTQEQLIMAVCPTIGINPVALRYQNVYGPGQSLSNPYTGILSIFSTRILNNNSINIFEDGLESRDFVYIDDVVQATTLALESDTANGQIYNVGAGVPVTVLEVLNQLMKCYNTTVPYEVTGNYRLGDIRHNYADISKISRELGFVPTVMFAEGIRKFSEWVLTQQLPEDKYTSSLDEMKGKGLFK